MTTSSLKAGPLIMDYLEKASYCSVNAPDKGLGVTRLYLTKEHSKVIKLVTSWMHDAGMTTRLDHAGTVLGILPGKQC